MVLSVNKSVGNFTVNGWRFVLPGAFDVLGDTACHHVKTHFQRRFGGLDNFQNHVVTAVGAFGVGGNVVLSAAVLDAFCFYVFGNKLSHTGRIGEMS